MSNTAATHEGAETKRRMQKILTKGTAKYKTDLGAKFPAAGPKTIDALVKYIAQNFPAVRFIREGDCIYHNRAVHAQQVRELRAFAYGLDMAGYNDE